MGVGRTGSLGMRGWICIRCPHHFSWEMSCILVVPGASLCHEEKLRCCSYSWEIPQLSLLCISRRTFFFHCCGLITVTTDKFLLTLKKACWQS